jgi:hypothetical protein
VAAFGGAPAAVDVGFAAMDRKLARRNIRSGLIAGAVCLFMFGMTFVAAAIYIS